MKYILTALCLSVLSGCSTSDGLASKTSHSGFDNARVVKIAPHGTACKTMQCITVGAEWHESAKQQVFLDVGVPNQIIGITYVELNIDGKKSYNKTYKTTNFTKPAGLNYSTNSVKIPMSTIDAILNSKKTWIRIGTTKGTMENFIIDGGVDSKAYHALKRFRASTKV